MSESCVQEVGDVPTFEDLKSTCTTLRTRGMAEFSHKCHCQNILLSDAIVGGFPQP